MKMIYKIAKTELKTLFYSPIAWLILIVFTIQSSLSFMRVLDSSVTLQELGRALQGITHRVYSHHRIGLFTTIQQYLYLYIPLLTMGLMSKEISYGSIKLLYSSPIKNREIILGKYLAMLFYSLIIVGILFLYVLYGTFTIENMDLAPALTGLLGMFLLISAYAAIGLFMSSLTSYQVVAAIGTLAILSLLNMVGNLWQEIALVREITYWLSIRGRSNEFISGLICSEDVLYFLIVIALFLSLAIIRLNAHRQKTTFGKTFSKYAVAFFVALFLGYFSARPKLMIYHDSTRTKSNTLTENSQNILSQLNEKVTIKTYSNILDPYYYLGLPRGEMTDLRRFRQYLRFKPDMKLKYYRYYHATENPSLEKRFPNMTDRERMLEFSRVLRLDSAIFKSPEEIAKLEDLQPEGYRFVRTIITESGKKTFLRVFDDMEVTPSEAEISAAFKRLVMPLPQVAFLTGHGERSSGRLRDRDYNKFAQEKPFRYSLINQGFDFSDIELNQPVPQEIDILIISDLRSPLTPQEMELLENYIDRGGNLIVAGEPSSREYTNAILAKFEVEMLPGTVVRESENYAPDFMVGIPTKEAGEMIYWINTMVKKDYVLSMPSTAALKYNPNGPFSVMELFRAESEGNIWNETESTNFIDGHLTINPKAGEESLNDAPLVIALNRTINDKEQKIIVLGDADCISNGEIGMRRTGVSSMNYNFIMGAFYWLSDFEVPIDVRRPPSIDNKLNLTLSGITKARWSFVGVIPLLLLISYLTIWIRRRRH
ncbi:MAG: Gldg family protein [Bacteroidales bacterium]